ncbi:PilZ domain-containing protein [bacterium]|nr:PilZ domain-containing protein [bacterium]
MGLERKFARVDMNYPVICVFTDNDLGKDIKATGYVNDLSLGGMKVRVPIPPELHNATSLVYSLTLPEPFHTLTGQGAIVWQDKNTAENMLYFGMSFSALSVNDRRTLLAIINELVEP